MRDPVAYVFYSDSGQIALTLYNEETAEEYEQNDRWDVEMVQ